jgi:hypothetical protein
MLDDTYGRDTNQSIPQFAQGAPVYDVNGDKVGTVADVDPQSNDLIIQKGLFFPKDFPAPMSVVARADADGIYLNVSKDEVTGGHLTTPDTSTDYDDEDVDIQTPYQANAARAASDAAPDSTPEEDFGMPPTDTPVNDIATDEQYGSDQPLTNP